MKEFWHDIAQDIKLTGYALKYFMNKWVEESSNLLSSNTVPMSSNPIPFSLPGQASIENSAKQLTIPAHMQLSIDPMVASQFRKAPVGSLQNPSNSNVKSSSSNSISSGSNAFFSCTTPGNNPVSTQTLIISSLPKGRTKAKKSIQKSPLPSSLLLSLAIPVLAGESSAGASGKNFA